MNRTVICLVLACVYLAIRTHSGAVVRPPVSPAAPIPEIASVAAKMTAEERAAMSDGYVAFSRAVAADPPDDSVFTDAAALRRSHRAMLLCVWRGVLNSESGKYPGLKEAVEEAFDQRIGSDDVLLTPSHKQSAAKALADIAASLK